MTHNTPDCIGAGNYYTLHRPESADGGASVSPSLNPLPQINGKPEQSEIRYHPDTDEAYCLPAIVSDLHHKDWYIRIRAAWALGSTRDVEGIVPLVEALHDEHKEVRDRAHEALDALESDGEPLAVRVLLCDAIDDATRTDVLASLKTVRATLHGHGSTRAYCEHWLDEDVGSMNAEEQAVLIRLKRSAAAVLAELSRRSDANVLLRAGDAHAPQNELLRSSEPGHRPGEVENLLLPSSEGTKGTAGTSGT